MYVCLGSENTLDMHVCNLGSWRLVVRGDAFFGFVWRLVMSRVMVRDGAS